MSELNILGICGSLRASSRNMGLLRCAAASLPDGAKLSIADISDLPFYAEDREKTESALRLIEQARRADAFVLACPEYNYSMGSCPEKRSGLDFPRRRQPAGRKICGHHGRRRRHGNFPSPVSSAPELRLSRSAGSEQAGSLFQRLFQPPLTKTAMWRTAPKARNCPPISVRSWMR